MSSEDFWDGWEKVEGVAGEPDRMVQKLNDGFKRLEEEYGKHAARPMYYGRDGKPMSLLEWGEAFEARDRLLRQEYVGPWYSRRAFWVSTVWLGIDYGWGMGPPLIFETMAFLGDETEQERYSTEEEALAGHEAIVRLVSAPGYLPRVLARRVRRWGSYKSWTVRRGWSSGIARLRRWLHRDPE